MLVLLAIGCRDDEPAGPGVDDNFGVVETKGAEGCDNLLPDCLYPFPSDAYVDGDHLDLPVLFDGNFDPSSTERNKGFGAATPILFELGDAVAPGAPFDSAPSLEPDSPTVLVDAQTGERLPHWVESDYLAPGQDPPLLVIRPAVPLPRGHEVVVGIRHLADAQGTEVEAPEAFAALRDGAASHWLGVHERRQHFEDVVFPALEATGVDRDELQLAWSFPIQSDADATAPLLAVRDAIFAALPAEGPAYSIDSVIECPHDGTDGPDCHPSIRLIVDGTVDVPSVVEPADELGVRVVRWGDDGKPVVDGVERWPFRLQLPNVAFDGPAPVPVVQYGHGLLGSRGEADNDWLRTMADRLGFAILACDMEGMNEDAATVWVEVIFSAGGRFPELQDLAFQGIVNQLVDQRAVKTTLAADPDPRLRRSDGQLAWDPGTVYYDGNSQGGSVGTVVTAVATDVTRGGLGVPGSGYPLLLHRSTDFAPFAGLLQLGYPQADSISVFLALLGTGWDDSDPLTFSPHLHGNPLPGTPDHEALFHVAKEDQQVVNEASFISGRAAGAVLMTPSPVDVFGLTPATYPVSPGTALVEYDFGVPDDPTPLTPADGDPSMPDDGDTHGWLRKYEPAQDQLWHFLTTGEVIDVCDGQPCFHQGPPE
jgi:hypothetical protein